MMEPTGPEESRPKGPPQCEKDQRDCCGLQEKKHPSLTIDGAAAPSSCDCTFLRIPPGPATPHLWPRRHKHTSLCLLKNARVLPRVCSFYRASLVVTGCITVWHEGRTTSWRKMLGCKCRQQDHRWPSAIHLGYIQLWPQLWQPLNFFSLSNFFHIIFSLPLHTEAISHFHTQFYSVFSVYNLCYHHVRFCWFLHYHPLSMVVWVVVYSLRLHLYFLWLFLWLREENGLSLGPLHKVKLTIKDLSIHWRIFALCPCGTLCWKCFRETKTAFSQRANDFIISADRSILGLIVLQVPDRLSRFCWQTVSVDHPSPAMTCPCPCPRIRGQENEPFEPFFFWAFSWMCLQMP